MADVQLAQLFRYYKALPHQDQAIAALEQRILKVDPHVFEQDQQWYKLWAPPTQPAFENTWEGVYRVAKAAGAKYPEVVAAQWALESGWGKHTSGANNYFGLKGSNGTTVDTKELVGSTFVQITDTFIDFPTPETGVNYLVSRWYKDSVAFHGVNRAGSPEECAELLVKGGYATDPEYAQKLIRLIQRQHILKVPYEYQLDNASGTGYRECFSSSCAMIARYYKRVESDDQYNSVRAQHGDTTWKRAQIEALKSLNLQAEFTMEGTAQLLEHEIDAGHPVAVGWLHKGPVTAPSGGGHWCCCIGHTDTAFVFNDPNGEADMVNGGYVKTDPEAGCGVRYSRKNWLKRWECEGPGSGWAILVKP